MVVRTRFAPSPTGYLHIGSVRTALYSWLYARRHQGTFILRIEDTDRERSTEESIQAILQGMDWLGLDYDEGPYYQTKRFDRYLQIAQQLLEAGKAYRCYCSKERLEKLREQQLESKQKPRYDGLCRDRQPEASDDPYVIRFCNPRSGEVVVDDQVYGKVTFQNHELDDLIIVRADGTPTYNFTVVVDDWDMQITHVIRGDDHLNNTPRQINILNALGAKLPIYAHLPMILGDDGKRLSKRHGAVSVLSYRDDGYLPQALLNYLLRLGWSHGDQEIFSRTEMIDYFDTQAINKAPAAFNPEKLLWLNQHYMMHMPLEDLAQYALPQFEQLHLDVNTGPSFAMVLEAQRQRAKTLTELAEKSRFFFEPVATYDEAAIKKNVSAELLPILQLVREHFQKASSWDKETLHAILTTITTEKALNLGKVAQPLRIAVTGTTVSPPIDLTLAILGQAETIARLDKFLTFMKGMA